MNYGKDLFSYISLTIVSLLYVPAVIASKNYMAERDAYKLKWTVFFWNAAFSILSAIGFVCFLVSSPESLKSWNVPFESLSTVCQWVSVLFVWSKILEFGDTALLIARKRPVIFLHVSHHCLTAVYALHSLKVRSPIAHYASFVNLGVHAIMYAYYAAGAVLSRNAYLRMMRPFITILQLSQMVFGLGFSLLAVTKGDFSGEVYFNCCACLAMYTAYFYLFLHLFLKSYSNKEALHHTFLFTPFILAIFGSCSYSGTVMDDIWFTGLGLLAMGFTSTFTGFFLSVPITHVLVPTLTGVVASQSHALIRTFLYAGMYGTVPATTLGFCHLLSIPVGLPLISISLIWFVCGAKSYVAFFKKDHASQDPTPNARASIQATRTSILTQATRASTQPTQDVAEDSMSRSSIPVVRNSVPPNVRGPFADECVDENEYSNKKDRSSIFSAKDDRSSIGGM